LLIAFFKHFTSLDDSQSHINKKYELVDVMFLTVVAILYGAQRWKDIKQFVDSKLSWLRKFRRFENEIPVDDTIARIISANEPSSLLACFMSWVNEIQENNGQSIIAFDGKINLLCGGTIKTFITLYL